MVIQLGIKIRVRCYNVSIDMSGSEKHVDKLQRLFQKYRVMEIKRLLTALKTRSRMTVFRYLRRLNYLTSYNESGRYYTLGEVAEFDEHGLWHFRKAYFSKHGTLKSTVLWMVEHSKTGHTQRELRELLRVRVQNALTDLTNDDSIGREVVGSIYLYTAKAADVASAQISARQKRIEEGKAEQFFDPYITIEVLLEIIRGTEIDADEIMRRLSNRSIKVKVEQVQAVFARYALDLKKN